MDRRTLAAALAFLALAVFWAAPSALHPTRAVPDLGDPLHLGWTMAWDAHQLVRHPLALFQANAFYPYRSSLTFADHLLPEALLVAPVNWLTGNAVLAYNLGVLAALTLSALSLFLLTRHLTGSAAAAFLAGLAYAFNAFTLHELARVHVLNLQWWPLAWLFLDRFVAEGIPTVIADPGDLEYDGKRLYVRTAEQPARTAIDLVYRRVLQHEFLAQYDLDHPLVRAYADHAVCVVNPFRTKPVHTKLIMALLSDEDGPAAGLLDAEERAAVARHVPWTRQVLGGVTRYQGQQVPLLTFAQRNREQLVLKPNDDYGGQGVLLGWETDQTSWDRALAAAQAAPFVLQERVPVPMEEFPTWTPEEGLRITPRYVDSDPCVYGDHAIGCLTRIAATALLNVSAGGGAAPPTFVVTAKVPS